MSSRRPVRLVAAGRGVMAPNTGPNREDITRMIPWHHEHPLLPRPATLAVVACILSSSLTRPAAAEDLTIVMRSANGTSTQYISSRLVRDSSPRVDRIYRSLNPEPVYERIASPL
jgi:hypothetical protein